MRRSIVAVAAARAGVGTWEVTRALNLRPGLQVPLAPAVVTGALFPVAAYLGGGEALLYSVLEAFWWQRFTAAGDGAAAKRSLISLVTATLSILPVPSSGRPRVRLLSSSFWPTLRRLRKPARGEREEGDG